MKNRVPKNKLVIISDAIFNSIIRYGASVYLKPIFEEEDLKVQKLSKHVTELQTLQNTMLRIVLGIDKRNHVNMRLVREDIKMMSVNQICIYHTLIEAYNVVQKSSSEKVQRKWKNREKIYFLRNVAKNDLKVPDKPATKCLGFSYFGAKLFNMLPTSIRENKNPNNYKNLTKEWIWKNIPSH